MTNVISVFGSSAPLEGSAEFEEAATLGRLLADAGFTVATGGYAGTMEAVSKGANETGGQVIGVACDQIEAYRPILPNKYVTQVIRYATLRERLLHLVIENTGVVVLPGSSGTLAEWAMAWNMLLVGELSPRPFVLVGAKWRNMIEAMRETEPLYTHSAETDLLTLVDTVEEAADHIRKSSGA